MKSIPKEYLLLFNAISDAEEILNRYARECEDFRLRKAPYELYPKEN